MLSNNTIKMSAAGSGKTWGICNAALSIVSEQTQTKKILITTYTNKGVDAICNEIRKQNNGVLHERIIVKSWYQFLLSELIRPYQTYIVGINEIRSFDFTKTYGYVNYDETGSKSRYIDKRGFVLSNYASELVVQLNQKSGGLVVDRIERIYSHVFVDEIQDLAGDDLSIIELLFRSKISTVCVGDNKQATYKTHNTRKKKKLSGAKIWDFFVIYQNEGLVKIERNLTSRRFNEDICQFANALFSNDNNMSTDMNEKTGHDGVFLIEAKDAKDYIEYFSPAVLKYDIKTKTDSKFSYNFGQCKGCTFDRVLIYPNGPLTKYLLNNEQLKTPYKYYVAVTRARYSMIFVIKKLPKQLDNYSFVDIVLKKKKIKAMKYKKIV